MVLKFQPFRRALNTNLDDPILRADMEVKILPQLGVKIFSHRNCRKGVAGWLRFNLRAHSAELRLRPYV
jgi:hypothetical protein